MNGTDEAETILRSLGLSYTDAINLFLNQVRMKKGLPFPVEIPDSVIMSVIECGRRRFFLKKSVRVRLGVEGSVLVYEYPPLGIRDARNLKKRLLSLVDRVEEA